MQRKSLGWLERVFRKIADTEKTALFVFRSRKTFLCSFSPKGVAHNVHCEEPPELAIQQVAMREASERSDVDSELCVVGMEPKMLAPPKVVDGRCCRTESISEPRSTFNISYHRCKALEYSSSIYSVLVGWRIKAG